MIYALLSMIIHRFWLVKVLPS